MDDSQITGTASSYARKYALNGLFLIDDTKDADTEENASETQQRAKKAVSDKKDEQQIKKDDAYKKFTSTLSVLNKKKDGIVLATRKKMFPDCSTVADIPVNNRVGFIKAVEEALTSEQPTKTDKANNEG